MVKWFKVVIAVVVLVQSILLLSLLTYRVIMATDLDGLTDEKAPAAIAAIQEIYDYTQPLNPVLVVVASALFFKRDPRRIALIVVLVICMIGLAFTIGLFNTTANSAMDGAAIAHNIGGVAVAEKGWPEPPPTVVMFEENYEMYFRLPLVEDAVNGILLLSVMWAFADLLTVAYMCADTLLALFSVTEEA